MMQDVKNTLDMIILILEIWQQKFTYLEEIVQLFLFFMGM
jgi:hypothetical protein